MKNILTVCLVQLFVLHGIYHSRKTIFNILYLIQLFVLHGNLILEKPYRNGGFLND